MWVKITDKQPPQNVFVVTKIDDGNGVRNEQKLKFVHNLWWSDDGMYVYYAPTHWRFE